jgi:hypothetical protein
MDQSYIYFTGALFGILPTLQALILIYSDTNLTAGRTTDITLHSQKLFFLVCLLMSIR